jgi:hypothetical protein
VATDAKICPPSQQAQQTEEEQAEEIVFDTPAPPAAQPCSKTELTGKHRGLLMDFFRKHDTRQLYTVDQQLAEARQRAREAGEGPLEQLTASLVDKYGKAPVWD